MGGTAVVAKLSVHSGEFTPPSLASEERRPDDHCSNHGAEDVNIMTQWADFAIFPSWRHLVFHLLLLYIILHNNLLGSNYITRANSSTYLLLLLLRW